LNPPLEPCVGMVTAPGTQGSFTIEQTGLKLSLATENQFITVHVTPNRSQQSRNTVAVAHTLVVYT